MCEQPGPNENALNALKNLSQSEFSELLNQRVLLGVGRFGTIFRVPWNERTVALKVYKSDQANKEVCHEISLLARCDHPNIVKIFGAGPRFPEKVSFLLMELAECFSINDVLYTFPNVCYELSHCLNWIARAADGAAYLHNQCKPPIVHGDLKPANMLLFNKGLQVKLTDFGSARSLDSDYTRPPGTLIYTAPEISCVREGMPLEYTEKSDVYALTISFWEVLARQRPYADLTQNCKFTIFWNVYRRRPTPLHQCPSLFSKLMERGWNEDSHQRPTMRQISTLLDGLNELLLSPMRIVQPLVIPSELPRDETVVEGDSWTTETDETNFVPELPTSSWCTTFSSPFDLRLPTSIHDGHSEAVRRKCPTTATPHMTDGKRSDRSDQPLNVFCNLEQD